MSDIYFIPQRLRCPECHEDLGSPLQLTTLGKVWCPKCEIMRTPTEFGKQFGKITNVEI